MSVWELQCGSILSIIQFRLFMQCWKKYRKQNTLGRPSSQDHAVLTATSADDCHFHLWAPWCLKAFVFETFIGGDLTDDKDLNLALKVLY